MTTTDTQYRIPTAPAIGSGTPAGKRVYATEAKLVTLIERLGADIASMWAEHVGEENARKYQGQVPEALVALLNRFDRMASLAAVVGWCLAHDGGEGIGVTVARNAAHFDGVGVPHEGTITITIPVACATRLYSPTGVL